MKPMEVMDDSSESGKKNQQRPSRILSSLRRNVNVFRSATVGNGANQVLEHETRPLTASMSGGAHGTGGIVGTSSGKHPHGHALPTHTKSKFEVFSVRDRRDTTGKRAFKVEVPKRMLYYTILVFLVLPLALFLWKEMHLDNHSRDPATHDLVKANMRGHRHDVYPTWMEDTLHSPLWNDPSPNEIGGVTTAAANDTKTTTDQPHHNDIGENVGAWDEVISDEISSSSSSNNSSGLPNSMVDPGKDVPGDSSSSLRSVSRSTEIISATTGIESDDPAKEQKTDSVKSSMDTTKPVSTDDDDGGTGNHDAALGGGDVGTGTGTKLSSESAGDLLGARLDSLGKESLGGGKTPSKDDDDVQIR